ncbi:MAG TPA: hypothetical protein VK928_09255 [Longimicrobiales bacterium]|nr:hypothetical protein [Longimicrobiales bacterium]
MSRLLLAALLLCPSALTAQSFAGEWRFQGPSGVVQLTVQQEGARLTGTMIGSDGTRFALQGTIEEGRATGRLQVAGGAGWFAAGIVDGRLKMVVAELDPVSGQPNLSNGWELDFARTGGGAQAPAEARPAPSEPAAPAGAGAGAAAGTAGAVPPQSEATPVLREWLSHLRGRKLSFRESYNSNDARGFGGYSNRWDAYLCSDGTFFFQESSRVSIDTGGAMGGGRSGSAARGIWRIVEANGQVVLQYRMEGTEGDYGVLRFQDGATYLDRSRIFVTNENPYCR